MAMMIAYVTFEVRRREWLFVFVIFLPSVCKKK
jgi:hypothetical protein